jgi:AcrR family transcriptional regulator
MSTAKAKKTGRRPGDSGSRDAIAVAARAQFAETGYDRATMRAIAQRAGVDPALVLHFFGSKEGLFREVMAMPPAFTDALASLATGPRETVGRRLAEVVVAALENPATRAVVVGRIRSATSHAEAAELVRQTVTRDLMALASALTDDHPEARAAFAAVQVVGVTLVRYIVAVEPLASMPPNELVDAMAPAFQRCLVEPLDASTAVDVNDV